MLGWWNSCGVAFWSTQNVRPKNNLSFSLGVLCENSLMHAMRRGACQPADIGPLSGSSLTPLLPVRHVDLPPHFSYLFLAGKGRACGLKSCQLFGGNLKFFIVLAFNSHSWNARNGSPIRRSNRYLNSELASSELPACKIPQH